MGIAPPSSEQVRAWLRRQRLLLARERQEEHEQSALLLSRCPPRLLERNGLALLGLGVASVSIGQGAKLCVLWRDAATHLAGS